MKLIVSLEQLIIAKHNYLLIVKSGTIIIKLSLKRLNYSKYSNTKMCQSAEWQIKLKSQENKFKTGHLRLIVSDICEKLLVIRRNALPSSSQSFFVQARSFSLSTATRRFFLLSNFMCRNTDSIDI